MNYDGSRNDGLEPERVDSLFLLLCCVFVVVDVFEASSEWKHHDDDGNECLHFEFFAKTQIRGVSRLSSASEWILATDMWFQISTTHHPISSAQFPFFSFIKLRTYRRKILERYHSINLSTQQWFVFAFFFPASTRALVIVVVVGCLNKRWLISSQRMCVLSR